MSLQDYRKKRNFRKTPEPTGGKPSGKDRIFVVQEHWASHLHYDFRLEAFGTLKSWAVPKGPSTKVGDKRLAVEVEDHPIGYAEFEGKIPEGEYGAGKVKIWDRGTWVPPKNIKENLSKGHLEFELHGKKLQGKWLLQRTKQKSGKKNQWLLIKRHDEPKKKSSKKVKKRADAFPREVLPQLALLSEEIPDGNQWIHEIKFDGYRTLVKIRDGKVSLITRNGHDWTETYFPLVKEFKKLKVKSAILDGEVVALNEMGQTDFSELQVALSEGDFSMVVFYAFDLLYLDGTDLTEQPLEDRKKLLKPLLKNIFKIKYSEHWLARGEELFETACKQGLEGIISKNRLRPYSPGRSSEWQKIKCSNRQEFVIGGFTEPKNSRQGIGAILLGAYDGDDFVYVGKVGTGFKDKILADLSEKLEKIETSKSPFSNSPKKSKDIHWVKPKLVCEIEFQSWSRDKKLRHAAFKGLRSDKPAKEILMTEPKKKPQIAKSKKSQSGSSSKEFRITHPERVVFPKEKITKLDVAQFYKSISQWLLPHILERPLSLIRCPDNINEECFFQKHIDNSKATEVRETLIEDQKVIYIESEMGLLQLIQWGVLEVHTWQTHIQNSDSPDQIVFDIDPAPKLKWEAVIDAVFEIKEVLDTLNLESFVKTTGGKGLHVHVPIAPKYSWDNVKAFAKTICVQLEEQSPKKYTTNMSKKKRVNKIFLDYLRNGFGATAVAPYALRAKKGATVAMPISWKELETLKGGDAFNIKTSLERLVKMKTDPWQKFFKLKQKVSLLE